jgi:hypothetical protein
VQSPGTVGGAWSGGLGGAGAIALVKYLVLLSLLPMSQAVCIVICSGQASHSTLVEAVAVCAI